MTFNFELRYEKSRFFWAAPGALLVQTAVFCVGILRGSFLLFFNVPWQLACKAHVRCVSPPVVGLCCSFRTGRIQSTTGTRQFSLLFARM